MQINQEVTVRADKIAHGGFVVARWEEKVIFVRKALPGELVKVKIIKKAPGGRAWLAETVEILEANSNRVEPPCLYFKDDDCGGCDFQHAHVDYQLELKQSVLIEQMQRLANVPVADLIQTHQLDPKDYRWRTKLKLAPNNKGHLGYKKFRTHQIIPIQSCQIAVSEINTLLKNSKGQIFDKEQLLVANESNAQFISVNSSKKSNTKILGFDFVHMRAGFWQSHVAAAEKLSSLLLSKVDFQQSTLDLYSGVGIFGRLLLETNKTKELISVELDRAAAGCAEENLKRFSDAKVLCQKAENYLISTNNEFELVILDPPRKGLGIEATRQLAKVAKRQIIYLSCDPASLARDTNELCENGWFLSQLDLIDAFPQTHHLEALAVFSKVN